MTKANASKKNKANEAANKDSSPQDEVEIQTDQSTGGPVASTSQPVAATSQAATTSDNQAISHKLDTLLTSIETMNEQLRQQDLRLRKQEERVSINELSVVAPSAHSSPNRNRQIKKASQLQGDAVPGAGLPSFDHLKTDSRIQAEVERRLQDYQQTSRVDIAGKPVQSLKSGRFRAGVAKIKNHVNWPQDFCSVMSGSKQPTYDELSNEQWIQGFLFCILDEQSTQVRENMLHYLTFLMQDAIELSMNTARKAHAAVLQDMERGKLDWSKPELVEKVKNRNTQRLANSVKTGALSQEKAQTCVHFNRNQCRFDTDHFSNGILYQHACSYCLKETGKKFDHSVAKCLRIKNSRDQNGVKTKESKA